MVEPYMRAIHAALYGRSVKEVVRRFMLRDYSERTLENYEDK
jgi:hypothetical protein